MAENTATKQIQIIEKVKAAIKEFEDTQRKHIGVGARDTEPDGVWQRLLLKAVEGQAPCPPRTARAWELLTLSYDCTQAAEDLFNAALKVIQLIESCSIRDYAELKDYINAYCWRCN